MDKKAREFDKDGEYRQKVDDVLELLKEFRTNYPFKAHPESIHDLTAGDIFNEGKDYFFRWIVYELKDLGYIGGYPIAFRNAREKLETFKGLLRIAVDEEQTLARKVDAPWAKIKGMGGDKHLAKKIIYCYNDDILPIFRTTDFEDFLVRLEARQSLPSDYDTLSTGKKYEFLTQTLLDVKRRSIVTKDWDNAYFMWFLYSTYKGY